MSTTRHVVLRTALASCLVGVGLLPLTMASAADCAAWSDPKGDSTTGQSGAGPLADAQLDLLGASIGTVGDSLVATFKTDALSSTSSDAGDEFRMTFAVGDVTVTMYTDRTAVEGETVDQFAGVYDSQGSATPSGAAESTYDVESKTVTITTKLSELAAATGGKAVAGAELKSILAESGDIVPLVGEPVFTYDDAATELTHVLGTACTMGAAPAPAASGTPSSQPSSAPSPTPSASSTGAPSPQPSASGQGSPSASPSASGAPGGAPATALRFPVAGCTTVGDDVDDAVVSPLVGGPGVAEDDLDLTGVVLRSTPQTTSAYSQVVALASSPSTAPGHSFFVNFTVGETAVQLIATQYDPAVLGQVVDGAAEATSGTPARRSPQTRLTVAGTYVESSIEAVFDVERNTVVVSIPTAELAAAVPGFKPGATLSKLTGRTTAQTPAIGLFVDSTAPENAAEGESKWVVGDNACFPPPLTNRGAVKAQFGDTAVVAAKLLDGSGAPAAGKAVTFTLGTSKAVATTGKDGIAKASLKVTSKAGPAPMKVASGSEAIVVPFTVLVEKTALKVTGGGGAVTATLTDDDRKAVAGQVVTFTAGSVTRSVRTGATGVAKAAGFPAGAVVKATYSGATGMYTAASGSAKA